MTEAPTTRETADHAELAACPFCGGTATIERFGNTRVSTQYQCDDCSCFLETGEEFHHGREWNRRPRESALLSEIAALRGEVRILSGRLKLRAKVRDRWETRATQAERQRDEAVGLLKQFHTRIMMERRCNSLGVNVAEPIMEKTRAFLANQGADQ